MPARGGRNLAARKAPPPVPGPAPDEPRPQCYKGGRRKGEGLPREAEVPSRGCLGSARLVSLHPCGGPLAGFCVAAVGWGLRAPRPPPSQRELAGSGRWL